jgi:hypothetical protein
MPVPAPTAQSNRAFVERFGATIIRGGVTAIPSALYLYQGELGLTPQLVWFISAILARKWNASLPYPSLKKMAERSGVSEQQLHNYKNQLVKQGWLQIISRRNAQGGQDTNFYDFSALFAHLEALLIHDQEEDGGEAPPSLAGGLNHSLAGGLNPDLDKEETEQEESLSSNIRKREITNLEELYAENTLILDECHRSSEQSSGQTRSDGSKQVQSESPPDTTHEPRSSAQSKIVRARAGSRERDAILSRIEQFAQEFGDKASLKSSTTRACNLLTRSALSVEEFVTCMWEARSIMRERLGSKAARKPINSKMGYFFGVLEERLGIRPSALHSM